jgi:branched-chain amino acid transport system substrate-binding protein
MIFTRKKGAVLAGTLLCLAVAACGSASNNSGSGGTSGSGGSGSSSAATSGAAVPIGTIGSFSGPQGAALVGAEFATKAWADWVNAHGGLAGHPVKLFVIDDGDDASKALTGVKTLVQTDHVVAIVGEHSDQDQSWASYIEGTGVPVVGGLPQDTPFGSNPDFYSAGGNNVALSAGTLAVAKKSGKKFGVLYCAEAPVCAQLIPLEKAVGVPYGVSLSFSQSILATAPSYTAECEAVKSSGIQSYQIAEAQPIVARVATACKQAGVTATLVGGGGTIDEASLSDPGENGAVGVELDFPFTADSNAATRHFQSAIKQYAPTIGQAMGPSATYAWASAMLLEAAVKASGSTDVTAASIKKGLYALPAGTTLGGLTPPLTFTQGKPSQVTCWFTDKVSGGKLLLPDGLKTTCALPAAVKAITP